jgi:hypothetical protein
MFFIIVFRLCKSIRFERYYGIDFNLSIKLFQNVLHQRILLNSLNSPRLAQLTLALGKLMRPFATLGGTFEFYLKRHLKIITQRLGNTLALDFIQ